MVFGLFINVLFLLKFTSSKLGIFLAEADLLMKLIYVRKIQFKLIKKSS